MAHKKTKTAHKDLLMDIPDEVVHNILSRLSAKPLMRFRCVSTYWNSQITDSYFKARRRVLFSDPFLYALDDKNVYSTINLPFPFQKYRGWQTSLIGSLNGIVILAYTSKDEFELILYNPLTREAKKLPHPPQSCCIPARQYRCAVGFGYGYNSTPDNSKIIIGYDKVFCECSHKCRIKYCHVFSLEKGSWTTPKTAFLRGAFIEDVGVFSDGYLHWISGYKTLEIVVLDVEKMKVSRMDVPDGGNERSSRLGTINGRLCMINKKHGWFDVWEMKTTKRYIDKWSKKYSFKLGIERGYKHLYALCILEDRRIVLMDSKSNILIFYDLSKGSHEVFKYTKCIMPSSTSIEYVESLASPSISLAIFDIP